MILYNLSKTGSQGGWFLHFSPCSRDQLKAHVLTYHHRLPSPAPSNLHFLDEIRCFQIKQREMTCMSLRSFAILSLDSLTKQYKLYISWLQGTKIRISFFRSTERIQKNPKEFRRNLDRIQKKYKCF
jgi:hypothetical protein